MTSSATAISLCIALLAGANQIPTSHAVTHQIDYNDERGEYCYHESFNLGACLGKQQQEQLDERLTEQQILQCLECSGNFKGDETCEELKGLNDVEEVLELELQSSGSETAEDRFDVNDVINWHESFCESYNICVAKNCPRQCAKEQDAWLECLIIELDCDWRCPGSTWLEGSQSVGMMTNGGAARQGYTYTGQQQANNNNFVLGMMLMLGIGALFLL